MLKEKISIYFLLVSIGLILVAGCVSQENDVKITSISTPTVSPIQTPTPQIVYVVVTVTQTAIPTSDVVTTISTTPVPTINPTIVPTETSDPILHRWIHITNNVTMIDETIRHWGAELHFYSDGTVSYNYGIAKEISSNYAINDATVFLTGTWSKVGENAYNAKMLNPAFEGSTPVVNNIFLNPGGENPEYPGINFPAYIEVQHGTSTWKYYQAKSDRPPT